MTSSVTINSSCVLCLACPAGCTECTDTDNDGTGTCTACDEGYMEHTTQGCKRKPSLTYFYAASFTFTLNNVANI